MPSSAASPLHNIVHNCNCYVYHICIAGVTTTVRDSFTNIMTIFKLILQSLLYSVHDCCDLQERARSFFLYTVPDSVPSMRKKERVSSLLHCPGQRSVNAGKSVYLLFCTVLDSAQTMQGDTLICPVYINYRLFIYSTVVYER